LRRYGESVHLSWSSLDTQAALFAERIPLNYAMNVINLKPPEQTLHWLQWEIHLKSPNFESSIIYPLSAWRT
jgi:hypothetical protein